MIFHGNYFSCLNFTIVECKTAFGLFDRDGDGYITTTDLGSALRSMGIFPTDNELMDILNETDPEGELSRRLVIQTYMIQ